MNILSRTGPRLEGIQSTTVYQFMLSNSVGSVRDGSRRMDGPNDDNEAGVRNG